MTPDEYAQETIWPIELTKITPGLVFELVRDAYAAGQREGRRAQLEDLAVLHRKLHALLRYVCLMEDDVRDRRIKEAAE